jgi:hypothetical protein
MEFKDNETLHAIYNDVLLGVPPMAAALYPLRSTESPLSASRRLCRDDR